MLVTINAIGKIIFFWFVMLKKKNKSMGVLLMELFDWQWFIFLFMLNAMETQNNTSWRDEGDKRVI